MANVDSGLLAGNGEVKALLRAHFAGTDRHSNSEAAWTGSFKTALSIVLHSTCPMFLVWEADRLLFYNDAYAALLPAGEHPARLGQPLPLQAGDPWQQMGLEIEQVFTAGQPRQRTHELQPLPSDAWGYAWSYSPVWDEADRVVGVLASGCQVVASTRAPENTDAEHQRVAEECKQAEAERKRLLQELTNERIRFEAVLRQMPEGVMIADARSGNLILANERTKQILQHSYDLDLELAAYEQKVPFQAYHADGRLYDVEDYPLVRSLRRGETVSHEEMRLHYADGQQVWIAASSSPIFDSQGQITSAVVVIQDITERKQTEAALRASETLYRTLSEAVPDFIWSCDAEGQVDFVNPRWMEYTGLTIEALNAGGLSQVNHPEDLPRLIAQWDLAKQRGELFEAEFRYRRQDGEYRWFMGRAVPLKDDSGRIVKWIGTTTDIHEKKLSEESLRQSEERLRLAQQAAGAGLWDWEITTNRVTWSAEYYALYGLDLAIVPSYETWLASVLPADRVRVDQAVREALEQRTNLNTEFRILHPVLGMRWLTAMGQTFYDAQGQPQRMTGIALDITDRKRVEAALRQSEARFQVLVKNIPGMVYRYFPDSGTGSFSYVSSGSRDLFELDPEVILQDAQSLWALIHPDDLEMLNASIDTSLQNVQSWQWEGRVITPSGQMKWVQGRSRPQETPYGVVWDGLLIDTSDRKRAEDALRQSEERYRYLVESIPQLVWTANSEGMLLDVSQRWSIFTGLTLEQAQLQGWQAIVHPDDIATLTQQWTVAQQNGSYYQAEGRMRRRDGLYRWYLHQAVPLKNEFGQIVKWFGTATDIENQKQLEQQRDRFLQQEQRAREQAEAANRIKDEFLAVLSHELRSPLNPILGWAKLLQSRNLDEQTTQHALETIERNAKLQTQLIEDLLDVSRILRGKLALHPTPVNLVHTIEAALETVRLAAASKGIQIHSSFEPDIGQATGDAARLQQVVWNLLSNAVKFTPPGGRVEVKLSWADRQEAATSDRSDSVSPQEPGGNGPSGNQSLLPEEQILSDWGQNHQEPKEQEPKEQGQTSDSPASATIDRTEAANRRKPVAHYAQITVTDTGKGINPAFLPHVFEYFRQEDGTTTRQFGGLGLGLAIVRHLVELHGGTVAVHSPGEGLGATFTVRLPLMPVPKATPGANAPRSSQAHLAQLKILVIDDEPDIRNIVAFILQEAGAVVQTAASAAEALQQLEQNLPDLLICDIGMPDVDGYMLMRQIRARPAEQGGNIPAIAFTAYAGTTDQRQALAAGFQQHLSKPIEPNGLVQTIASLMQQVQSGRL